jgi:hypothetical protein
LEKIVNAARQEFPGFTDEQAKDLWIRLKSLLIKWANQRGEVLPTYRFPHRIHGKDLNTFPVHATLTNETDFVVLFFLADRY